MSSHWVYVVRCADGTFYTGYTTDVERRVAEHNNGTGAKYTRGRTPVEAIFVEPHPTRADALSREAELKSLSHHEKRRLAGDGLTGGHE